MTTAKWTVSAVCKIDEGGADINEVSTQLSGQWESSSNHHSLLLHIAADMARLAKMLAASDHMIGGPDVALGERERNKEEIEEILESFEMAFLE